MLMLFGWILGLGFLLLGCYGAATDRENTTVFGLVFGIILTIVMLITSITIPIANESRLQEMEAFYRVNQRNYQVTVTRAELILSEQQFTTKALIPIEGSIEKIDVGSAAIDRLVEWRDKVTRYNTDLAKFRYFDEHPIIGVYYPTPGEHLKYMLIK